MSGDTIAANDGVSRITLVPGLGQRPFRIEQSFTLCNNKWILDEIDIEINADLEYAAWPEAPTPSQYDLATVLMGALGHALGLESVRHETSVMHHPILPGVVRDQPSPLEAVTVQQIIAGAQQATGCSVQAMQMPTVCGTGYGTDLQMMKILAPNAGYCEGQQPVVVRIKNQGTTTINSATIHASTNGGSPLSYSWTGSLLHGDSATVEMGGTILPTGNVEFQVWCSLVNGQNDEMPLNDTLSWSGTIGNCTSHEVSLWPAAGTILCTEQGLAVRVQSTFSNNTPLKGFRIDHTVNGMPRPPIFWSGNIAPGYSETILLGPEDLQLNVPISMDVTLTGPNGVETVPPGGVTLDHTYAMDQLSGTYTVGSSGADHLTLTEAFAALNSRGMCGEVIFELQPGSYSGSYSLALGNENGSRVTVRSETGEPSDVILTSQGNGNFVSLTNTKMTFEGLTFSTGTNVFQVMNSDSVIVSNCHMIAGGGSAMPANAWFRAEDSNDLLVKNVTFQLSGPGMFVWECNRVTLENCVFNASHDALQMHTVEGLELTNNTFERGTFSGYRPVELIDLTGLIKISSNLIRARCQGLIMTNCSGTNSIPIRIWNNHIAIADPQLNFTGCNGPLVLSGISHADIVHNTLLFKPHAASTASVPALHLNNVEDIQLRNSILAAYGYGTTVKLLLGDWTGRPFHETLYMDHNGYYAGGALMVVGNSTGLLDFTAVKGFLPGMNDNSIIADPEFVDVDDPVLYPRTVNHALFGAGSYSLYLTDREGDPRLFAPTIGADQVGSASFDLGITLPQTDGILCANGSDILVDLHNYGIDTLTTATLAYHINGTPAGSATWNGALPPGGSITNVLLGTLVLSSTDTLLTVIISSVEGTTDPIPYNDSAALKIQATGVQGTFPISTAAGLQQLFTSLHENGICGDVTIELEDGTYSSPLSLGTIPGSAPTARVRVTSASQQPTQCILGAPGTGATLQISSARHIHFDHLTLATASNNIGVLGLNNLDIRFDQCPIAASVIFDGTGVVFSNCQIPLLAMTENQLRSGLTLINDEITTLTVHEMAGIEMRNCTVSGNTTFKELYSGEVEQNVFKTLELENSNGTPSRPLTIAHNRMTSFNLVHGDDTYFNARSQSTHVYNNTITDFGTGVGIHILEFTIPPPLMDLRFFNNIVAGRSPEHHLIVTQHTLDLSGAIFDNNCYYSRAPFARMGGNYFEPNLQADDLSSWKGFTGMEASSFLHLPAFVDTLTDVHVLDDVMLRSRGLAIPEGSVDLDGDPRANAPDLGMDEFTVTPIPLDASPRDIAVQDMACADETGNVVVKIRNSGTDVLTSLQLNWSVNGVVNPSVPWTGVLLPDSVSDWLQLGTYTVGSILGDTIRAWTSLPNGTTDMRPENDHISSGSLRWPLNGTYTIGVAANNDLHTLPSATSHLTCLGVCGPVSMDLVDANYNDPIRLWLPIPGASGSDTVSFRGAGPSGHSSIFQSEIGSYPLNIKLASHLRFSKLHATSSSSSALVIEFAGNIHGRELELTGDNTSGWFFDTGTLRFDSCAFSSNNIAFYGNGLNRKTHLNDCVLTGTTRGIYMSNCGVFDVERCQFPDGGLKLFGGWDSVFVNANRFNQEFVAEGQPANIHYSLITNNWFDGPVANMMFSGCDSALVFNNSVRGSLPWPDRGVIRASSSPLIRILNNALYRTNAGAAISIINSAGAVSDHNVIYNGGTTPLAYSGSGYNDLSEWQQLGYDANSIMAEPFFGPVGDPDLSPILDNGAIPLEEVQYDISGYPRNPVTPDIGADEFIFTQNDAGSIEMQWSGDACSGTVDLSVRIKNFGAQTMTTANILVEKDGVITSTVPWSGSLELFEVSPWISLGSHALPTDTTVFRCWTSLPNGMPDQVNSNDTIPAAITVYKGMVGTIPVGPGNPYTDTHAITQALRIRGICGPVRIEYANGIYAGQDTLPSIQGSSAINTITFTSAAGDQDAVTLISTILEAPLVITGADHVIFEHLGMEASVFYGGGLYLADTIQDLSVRHCKFFAESAVNGINNYGIRSMTVAHVNGLTIDSCLFTNITGPIVITGSDSEPISNIAIRHNRFVDVANGISLTHADSVHITNNFISNHLGAFWPTGIMVGSGSTPLEITNNEIHNRFTGIHVRLMNGSSAEPVRIINNAYSQESDPTYNYQLSNGVRLEDVSHTLLVHNTVRMNGTQGGVAAFRIENNLNTPQEAESFNNIWVNEGAGAAVSIIGDPVTITGMHHEIMQAADTLVLIGNMAYTEMDELQTSTGLGIASHQAMPAFIGAEDCRIAYDPFASSNALATSIAPLDIDLETRTSPADIGCDEFGMISIEAGAAELLAPALPCDSIRPTLRIQNNGITALTTAQLGWQVNNGAIIYPIAWTGSIPSLGSSGPISLGAYPITGGNTYLIKAWVTLPNGNADPFPVNDTLSVTFSHPAWVDLGPDPVLCPDSVVVLDAGAGADSYTWSTNETTASITIATPGTYTVSVVDPQGCISNDQVVVTASTVQPPLISWNGSVLVSSVATSIQWYFNGVAIAGAVGSVHEPQLNGSYTVQVTGTDGCTATSAPHLVNWVAVMEQENKDQLVIAPIPADDHIWIDPGHRKITGLRLLDGAGRIVLYQQAIENRIHVRSISSGSYVLQLEFEDGSKSSHHISILH